MQMQMNARIAIAVYTVLHASHGSHRWSPRLANWFSHLWQSMPIYPFPQIFAPRQAFAKGHSSKMTSPTRYARTSAFNSSCKTPPRVEKLKGHKSLRSSSTPQHASEGQRILTKSLMTEAALLPAVFSPAIAKYYLRPKRRLLMRPLRTPLLLL